ncbi:FAD-dependent oxidoreductase [Plantibacter sp. M259]|uniref:FAD-dependent oxidoreductase n=1 Tax=Plantibacter sp. M259 TaxID=2583822 RepID=UPI003517799A
MGDPHRTVVVGPHRLHERHRHRHRPEEAALASSGIRVERGAIAELEGGRDGFTGVRLADGALIPRSGGFVRPQWAAPLGYLEQLSLDRDTDGYVVVDAWGRTSVPGVYAAGTSRLPVRSSSSSRPGTALGCPEHSTGTSRVSPAE